MLRSATLAMATATAVEAEQVVALFKALQPHPRDAATPRPRFRPGLLGGPDGSSPTSGPPIRARSTTVSPRHPLDARSVTRIRRTAAVGLLATAAALPVIPDAHAAFERPRTCRSGVIIFREGPVRVLRTEGTVAGEQAFRYYVCSALLRRPKLFIQTSPGLDETLSTFRRSGRRVAFVSTLVGGESFDQVLGWVDLHTGRRRLTGIREQDEGPDVLAVTADARGGIAYLQDRFDDGAQRIGYARLHRDGQLGVPRPRALVTGSLVVPRSLAVSGRTITWSTRSGAAGAACTGDRRATGGRE